MALAEMKSATNAVRQLGWIQWWVEDSRKLRRLFEQIVAIRILARRLFVGVVILSIGIGSLQAGELHDAVQKSNIEDVQRLLQAHPELISSRNEYGDTPLLYAVKSGRRQQLVELLLANHADTEGIDNDGRTALHWAAINRDSGLVELLLKYGAMVEAKSRGRYTPLHSAAMFRCPPAVLEALLKAGADVNARTTDEKTPLILATWEKGNAHAVETLLAHKADVNACDRSGQTALISAAIRSDSEVLELILKAKADVNAQTEDGYTALYLAVRQGQAKSVELLLTHGAEKDVEDNEGRTALGLCQANSSVKHFAAMAELLVKAGAVKTGSRVRRTNIYSAALQGDSERVKILLRENRSLANARASRGGDPVLCRAVFSGNRATVEALLEVKADVNVADDSGFTPLHVAAQRGNVEIATLLLTRGAQVKAVDGTGRTALHAAAYSGSAKMIELLIAHGAEVNVRNKDGASPLDFAMALRHMNAVEMLRNKGAK